VRAFDHQPKGRHAFVAKVKIHVWHKVTGEIVAVGRSMGEAKCIPVSGEGQSVLETEIEEKNIKGLHQTHIVDVHQRAVVKHGYGDGPGPRKKS
jgi:hypothetical protein